MVTTLATTKQVNDEMQPMRAHVEVLLKSKEAALFAKIAEAEAKLA